MIFSWACHVRSDLKMGLLSKRCMAHGCTACISAVTIVYLLSQQFVTSVTAPHDQYRWITGLVNIVLQFLKHSIHPSWLFSVRH